MVLEGRSCDTMTHIRTLFTEIRPHSYFVLLFERCQCICLYECFVILVLHEAVFCQTGSGRLFLVVNMDGDSLRGEIYN